MKLFTKKLTLSFYGYFSSLIIILFMITCILERCFPTGILVKSLIAVSLIVFFTGILIYIINESREKPVISVIMIALIMGLAGIYFFEGDRNGLYNMNMLYSERLLLYENAEVAPGFELKNKTDQYGLVHSFWCSMVKAGCYKRDIPLILRGIKMWFADFRDYDFSEDRYHYFRTVSEDERVLPGDIRIKDGRIYVYAGLLKNGRNYASKWIYAPADGKVCLTEKPDYDAVYRWKYIDIYNYIDKMNKNY